VTNKGKKLERCLSFDMSFDKALQCFVMIDPKEVGESIERSKAKSPRQDDAPPRARRGLR
jgi:hypothetical protein